MVIQLAVLLMLTGAAIGAGFFAGNYLGSHQPAADDEQPETRRGHAPDAPAPGAPAAGHAGDTRANVVDLAPMTTNIAAPDSTWIRIEVSLAFKEKPLAGMVEKVQEDFLSYIRTVKLHQLEGSSGYLHFRDDLLERANIRTSGKVEDVMIRTMLFE